MYTCSIFWWKKKKLGPNTIFSSLSSCSFTTFVPALWIYIALAGRYLSNLSWEGYKCKFNIPLNTLTKEYFQFNFLPPVSQTFRNLWFPDALWQIHGCPFFWYIHLSNPFIFFSVWAIFSSCSSTCFYQYSLPCFLCWKLSRLLHDGSFQIDLVNCVYCEIQYFCGKVFLTSSWTAICNQNLKSTKDALSLSLFLDERADADLRLWYNLDL